MATEAQLKYVISVQDRELKALKKELKETGRVAGNDLSKGVGKGSASLQKLNRVTNVAGALLAGGLVIGLKKSVDAAKDAEASQAKVRKMLENNNISWAKHGKRIDQTIQKHSQLTGFDDEELAESFANMVRTTGDLNEAFRLNGLAADVARTKGTGLAGAQSLLARVYNGSFLGLKKLGIGFVPTTKAQDKLRDSTKEYTRDQMAAAKQEDLRANRQAAIALLQKKFGGQAEAYGKTTAGASDRARVAAENFAENLGASLLPQLTKLLTTGADVLNWASENKTATKLLIGTVLGLVVALKLFIVAGRVYAAVTKQGTLANKLLNNVLKTQRALMATSLIGALVLLGIALVILWKKSETFRKIVKAAFEGVKTAVFTVVKFIISVFDKWLGMYSLIIRGIGKVADKFLPGSPFARAADAIDGAREKVRGLRDQIDKLHGKKVKVTVDFSLRASAAKPREGDIGAGDVRGIVTEGIVNTLNRNPALMAAGLGAFGAPIQSLSPALWAEAGMAQRMGLQLTSTYRPGATVAGSGSRSDHSYFPSKAFDAAGPAGSMRAFALTVAGLPGVDTVIHSGLGRSRGLWKSGFGWGGITSNTTYADHFSHVHVDTYDRGGWLRPHSATLAINRTGDWEPVGPPGRGGDTFVFNFPNYVGTKEELARTVRQEFDKYDRRNGR